jgi:penicillin amidase
VDPPVGRIWTANARVVSGEKYEKVQEGAYDLGARQKQIRDDLLALDKATEKDLLKVQLDDRALFHARWRELLLKVLAPDAVAKDPRRAEMRDLVDKWGGRASVDSVGYRIVRGFRLAVAEAVLVPLTAPCKEEDEHFTWTRIPFYEGPLWALVTARPPHLLDSKYATWDDLLLAAADATLAELTKDGKTLAAQTWGVRNTSLFQHPLSRAVPSLARFLDVPPAQLPGDSHMPRFQAPTSGASERLVVSPGREAEGIFHMPVGQSGHPLSPYYQDGHDAWVKGEPTPFLPGPAVHVLTLAPSGN